jgi:hypothetical protein
MAQVGIIFLIQVCGLLLMESVVRGQDSQLVTKTRLAKCPILFTAGLVARGFLPSRPTDMAGFGVVQGRFSNDLRDAQEREQLLDPLVGVQNYETVFEVVVSCLFSQELRLLSTGPSICHATRWDRKD